MSHKYTTISVIEATGAERGDFEEGLWPLLTPEDGCMVEAQVSARMVREDYGVPGSPVWYSPEDIEVDYFDINGERYFHDDAVSAFGREVTELLEARALEAADSIEWDQVEATEYS